MELPDFEGYTVPFHHQEIVAEILEGIRAKLGGNNVGRAHMLAALRELPGVLFSSAPFMNGASEGSVAHELFIRPICRAVEFEDERKYLLALVIRELASMVTHAPIQKYIEQHASGPN